MENMETSMVNMETSMENMETSIENMEISMVIVKITVLQFFWGEIITAKSKCEALLALTTGSTYSAPQGDPALEGATCSNSWRPKGLDFGMAQRNPQPFLWLNGNKLAIFYNMVSIMLYDSLYDVVWCFMILYYLNVGIITPGIAKQNCEGIWCGQVS